MYGRAMGTCADVDVADPNPDAWDSLVVEISDEELTALALAADPECPIDPQALPMSAYRNEFPQLLPDWYMPTPAAHSASRRKTIVVSVVVLSLLFINAFGLCVTYGRLEIPF